MLKNERLAIVVTQEEYGLIKNLSEEYGFKHVTEFIRKIAMEAEACSWYNEIA